MCGPCASEAGESEACRFFCLLCALHESLFHELVDQAVTLIIPVSPPELARQARRSPTHVGIAKTCEAVIRKQLKWKGRVVQSSFSPELVVFAGAFVALQEARYIADYDLGSRLDKADAAALVEQARQALGGAAGTAAHRRSNSVSLASSLLQWQGELTVSVDRSASALRAA